MGALVRTSLILSDQFHADILQQATRLLTTERVLTLDVLKHLMQKLTSQMDQLVAMEDMPLVNHTQVSNPARVFDRLGQEVHDRFRRSGGWASLIW